jgi:hypothetical protein
MEEFNFDTVGKWLSTTEQQFHIIKTLYKLESKNAEATPKNIGKEYTRLYGKIIQKPNLFTILRALLEKNLIQKDANSNYRIKFDGIRHALGKHKEHIESEGSEFKKAYSSTEDYFRRNMPKSDRPTVDYYDRKELYAEILKSLSGCDTMHIAGDFPSISYTFNIATVSEQLEYLQAVWKRCFKEKNLTINYLTTLDVDYLFAQALLALEEPKLAFKECELILQQLENQVEAYSKLNVKVVEEQRSMDVCIPLKERPAEFFLFIKDEHKDITGGIRIKSPETASQAENMFHQGFNYAEDLTAKALRKAHKKLEQEYGILE